MKELRRKTFVTIFFILSAILIVALVFMNVQNYSAKKESIERSLNIIDERRGRKVAQQLGITITGTVGILVQANDEGMLSKADAKTCLNFLKQSNIRLSENLIQDALDMMK